MEITETEYFFEVIYMSINTSFSPEEVRSMKFSSPFKEQEFKKAMALKHEVETFCQDVAKLDGHKRDLNNADKDVMLINKWGKDKMTYDAHVRSREDGAIIKAEARIKQNGFRRRYDMMDCYPMEMYCITKNGVEDRLIIHKRTGRIDFLHMHRSGSQNLRRYTIKPEQEGNHKTLHEAKAWNSATRIRKEVDFWTRTFKKMDNKELDANPEKGSVEAYKKELKGTKNVSGKVEYNPETGEVESAGFIVRGKNIGKVDLPDRVEYVSRRGNWTQRVMVDKETGDMKYVNG